MLVRIDNIDERDFKQKLVFPDLLRLLRMRRLPRISAWQTHSNDGLPAMRVKLLAPPETNVLDFPDETITLELQPYEKKHESLNALLIFRGLKQALANYHLTAAEKRGSGRGSELATRVTAQIRGVAIRSDSGRKGTPPASVFVEGSVQQVLLNRYERDPVARMKCIQAHGTACAVCSLDFAKAYGEVMQGFVHVHHLVPLSKIGANYRIDPVRDLRPVCPNCHAVLHRKDPPYSIEEVRNFLRARRGG
jgi:hypothetical protein